MLEGGADDDQDEYQYQGKQEFIRRLEEGTYFGEVSLITNLK